MLLFFEKQLFQIFYLTHRLVCLFSRPPSEIVAILKKEDMVFLTKVHLDDELDRINHYYYHFPNEASEMIDKLEMISHTRKVPSQWHEAFIRRLRGVRNKINLRMAGMRKDT